MGFWKGWFGKKKSDAKNALIAELAKQDFAAVKAGQIAEMKEIWDGLTRKLVEAKRAWEQEKADVVRMKEQISGLESDITKLLEAAEAEGTSQAKAKKYNDHAGKLMDELEALKKQLPIEEQEEADAKLDLDELETAVKEYGNKIQQAEKAMDGAKKEMDRAQRQADAAEERQRRSEELAGLRDAASGFGTVVDALTKEANRAKDRAEMAKVQSGHLKSGRPEADKDISSVLSGTPAKESAADRFARLKKTG